MRFSMRPCVMLAEERAITRARLVARPVDSPPTRRGERRGISGR